VRVATTVVPESAVSDSLDFCRVTMSEGDFRQGTAKNYSHADFRQSRTDCARIFSAVIAIATSAIVKTARD
jgi:hypothetical protein